MSYPEKDLKKIKMCLLAEMFHVGNENSFENWPKPMIIFCQDGYLLDANQAILKKFGWENIDDVEWSSLRELISSEQWKRLKKGSINIMEFDLHHHPLSLKSTVQKYANGYSLSLETIC